MLLIDKYRPNNINEYLFNQEVLLRLYYLAQHDNIPHLILVGPPSSGKSMMLKHLLIAIHGREVTKTKMMKFKISGSNSKKDIELVTSDYHIVIEPTNTNHDRHLLSGVIKQYAMEKPIAIITKHHHYKTIVIKHLEKLSYSSQATLRKILEEYSSICRFIMICDNITVIMEALRSRCQSVRVPHPPLSKIRNVITYIARHENMEMEEADYLKILKKCNYNVKNAIWLLDKKKMGVKMINSTDEVYSTIAQLVIDAITNDNISSICHVNRFLVYKVLVNNINGSDIIKSVMDILIERIDNDAICFNMLKLASKAELNLNEGRREVMHIEVFLNGVIKELRQTKKVKIIGSPSKYCFDIIIDPEQLDIATANALSILEKSSGQ